MHGIWQAQVESLKNIITFLQGNNGALTDTSQYLDTAGKGASDLYDGIGTLKKDGTDELKDGIGKFYNKTKDMDTQVEDAVDDMIDSVSAGDYETVSFVSDKNENVEAVQFVIKTSAIEKEETAETATEDEKLSVWQKFIKLFK